MRIIAEGVGKKFISEWIFRNVTLQFTAGSSYTLVGPNGSGKSTLLQLLMGVIPTTEGTLHYEEASGRPIDPDDWYRHIVMAAPYLELIEEFTLQEQVAFHTRFKTLKNNMTVEAFMERIELPQARHKVLRHFSSGMKQRVKLGLALFSEAGLVVLDEPTSNLDHQGMAWYLREVTALEGSQILLIGSNQPQEYSFCKNIISVSTFK